MVAQATRLPFLSDDARAALSRLGVSTGVGHEAEAKLLPLDWPELARVLPDGGLPLGVIELASPITKTGAMKGGATTIALASVRAIHAQNPRAWCAWVTPSSSPMLYAPAVAQADVDLDRLLVVRPDPSALARTVVKVAASGAFDLVVVDAQQSGLDGRVDSALPGPPDFRPGVASGGTRRGPPRVDGSVIVRKLALDAEERGTASILLTNVYAPRPLPWPVALRLEVERRTDAIAISVTKDRRGRASARHVVRLARSSTNEQRL